MNTGDDVFNISKDQCGTDDDWDPDALKRREMLRLTNWRCDAFKERPTLTNYRDNIDKE
jgi:hypothetical protein